MLVACAPTTLNARAYGLTNGTILNAQFLYDGTGRGTVEITTADDHLVGEYLTIIGGATASWGNLYGQYYSLAVTPNAHRGSAVATSVRGTGMVIECEYVTTGQHGNGVCRDNRGEQYRLIF
jgi:hypothetical protein